MPWMIATIHLFRKPTAWEETEEGNGRVTIIEAKMSNTEILGRMDNALGSERTMEEDCMVDDGKTMV